MSVGSDTTWVGKKPLRRIGGMSDALSVAVDLGFSVAAPPSQKLSTATGEKDDDLIRVLRELTNVRRKIPDLQMEFQGRKDDKNVVHLTHRSEMEKKIETLARITTILRDVIQNKDCIIAHLQQPYSLDCIPVEAEYQLIFNGVRTLRILLHCGGHVKRMMSILCPLILIVVCTCCKHVFMPFSGLIWRMLNHAIKSLCHVHAGNTAFHSCCFSVLHLIL